jgi:hypothetical protein
MTWRVIFAIELDDGVRLSSLFIFLPKVPIYSTGSQHVFRFEEKFVFSELFEFSANSVYQVNTFHQFFHDRSKLNSFFVGFQSTCSSTHVCVLLL